MNIIFDKKESIKKKYYNVWRVKKQINSRCNKKDNNNYLFPWPVERQNEYPKKKQFLKNLQYLQTKSNYTSYDYNMKCHICGERNISNKLYNSRNKYWEDSMYHYVSRHNVKVSNEFLDFVFNEKDYTLLRLRKIGKYKIKLTRNQLNIMDSLLYSGGSKKIYEKGNKFFYSEHFGLLDFNKNQLETFLIDANTVRVDKGDDSILMPLDRKDIKDYEYIFHTHPAEDNIPGKRVQDGILYEYPSVNDIEHFIFYNNKGLVQGSIVNAPEGLYIIELHNKNEKIKYNETIFQKLNEYFDNLQDHAIKKYGKKINNNMFYQKIINDTFYIDKVNELLIKVNIFIQYFPRIKNKKGKWVLPEIELNVNVVN